MTMTLNQFKAEVEAIFPNTLISFEISRSAFLIHTASCTAWKCVYTEDQATGASYWAYQRRDDSGTTGIGKTLSEAINAFDSCVA